MVVVIGGGGWREERELCVGAGRVGQGSGGRAAGGVERHGVHRSVSKVEGVTRREADVGTRVDRREGRRDGAVAGRDVRVTAAELERGGTGDGAHVVRGVPAVRLVAAPRE